MIESLGRQDRRPASRRAMAGRKGKRGLRGVGPRIERLEERVVLDATITPSVSGTAVTLGWTGDTSADSLTITYDDNTLEYTFSDPGHTIDVTSDPSVIIGGSGTDTVTIAPAEGYAVGGIGLVDGNNSGTPVGGNTYTIGDALGFQTGAPVTVGPETGAVVDTINIGDPSNPLGAVMGSVSVNYTGSATAAIVVNDSAGTSAATYGVTGSSVSDNGTTVVDFAGSNVSSLTVDGSSGVSTVNVTGTPAGATTTLAMGTSNANQIFLGDSGHVAATLGDVVISGTSGLTVNDMNDSSAGAWTISSAVVALTDGPTFAYSTTVDDVTTNADIYGLTFDGGSGATTVDVTGSPPEGTGLSHIALNMGASASNAITLGGPGAAAGSLGNLTISGTTGLAIDDAADPNSLTVAVNAGAASIGDAPTFDYSGATLSGLSVQVSDQGGTTLNVTGLPTTTTTPELIAGANGLNWFNLGDPTHAVSSFLPPQLTITSLGSAVDLTMDDTAQTVGQTVSLTAGTVTIGSSVIDDSGVQYPAGVTFEAGTGGDTVTVTSTPTFVRSGTVTLQMGTPAVGETNLVNLGDPDDPASALGSVTITGTTGLIVDDSEGGGSETVDIGASALDFGGAASFDYAGADLAGLTLDAADEGNVAVTVTGSPAADADGGLAPITLAMGAGTGNAVQLGDSTHAADALGGVTITTAGADPDPGTTSLEVDDAAGAAGQTITVGASSLAFAGGPTFDDSGAKLVGLTLDAGTAGGNTITVTGSPQLVGLPTTIDDAAPSDNPDAIAIGDAAHPASGFQGNVNVTGSGYASLTIDDSGSTAASTDLLQSGQFTIGATPVFDFSGATNLTGLTLVGSSGGDIWDVDDTSATLPTTIDTAPGSDLIDTVMIGGTTHHTGHVQGEVVVHGGGAGLTSLVADNSSGWNSHSATLAYDSTNSLSDLTGLAPGTIAYDAGVAQVTLIPSSRLGATTTLTVDFSQGNPLPTGIGRKFEFAGQLGDANTLVLQGELPGPTPFDSETYAPTANQPGSGTITLEVGGATSVLDFGGLIPITDTVPVANYVFVAPSGAQVVNLVNGPIVDTTVQTDTISSGDTPSAFELVNFANKGDVTVDLTAITDPTYIQPPALPATGLNDLTILYFGPDTTGHTLIVDGTTPGTTTTIGLGGNGNTVLVEAVTTGGPLVINNTPGVLGGVNAVSIGDNGSLANIGSDVSILGPTLSTNLTIDGSSDTTSFTDMLLELSGDQSMDDLTGVLPGGMLSYVPTAIRTMSLSTGTGSDNLTVDFANGDPFLGSGLGVPAPSAYTLSYDGGGGGDSLTILDSANDSDAEFDSETYTATGPGSGTIGLGDGSSPSDMVDKGGVQFSNLTPVTDLLPVTNYTFVAPASGGSIALTDASTPGEALISGDSFEPSFESVTYSGKAHVTIDATAVDRNNSFLLNNPDAPTGEQSLVVKLGSGNDTVNIAVNPSGVVMLLDGGAGSQAVTVDAAGLAAGTIASGFWILGGAGPNTLLLNDQGTGVPITLQAGTSAYPAIASFGDAASITFMNMGAIQGFETNDAPEYTGLTPVSTIPAQQGVSLVNVPVATFQDADLIENASSYQATIDWGDGTAPTAGTIAADPSHPGQYIISGSHTYAAAGEDTITVTLTDLGGTYRSTLANVGGVLAPVATQLDAINPVAAATATAIVADPPTPTPTPTPAPGLSWGRLSPQSDSGVSDSDGITNITTPTFVGGATPGAVVQVFETPAGSSAAPVLIASGVANAAGTWSATVLGSPMTDGTYQITAIATNGGGSASTSLGTVVIDTVAPVITDVVFNRLRGELAFSFVDNLSGVFLADLSNGANYQVSGRPLNNHTPVPRVIIPTSIAVTPGATATSVDQAAVFLNHGKPLRGGHYTIQVLAAGITDLAGNALNGRFYGKYPSGNMDPGGNYVSQITALPRTVLGAFPIRTGYAKPKPIPAARPMARAEAVAQSRHAIAQAKTATRSHPAPAHLVDRAIAALVGIRPRRHGR